MNVLVITDNEYIFNNFQTILKDEKYKNFNFLFRFSLKNQEMKKKYCNSKIFKAIDIKEELQNIIENYDMVISLHCKQLFPQELVANVKCINVHPGFNPYNRGWFPQVFSIINKLECGVTIHKIDGKLDHGNILFQEKIEMYDWDTSLSLYNRIQEKEIEILRKHLYEILTQELKGFIPKEGNVNTLKDFKKLCQIDLSEKVTMREAIDRLRALSHGDYKNAYFFSDNHKIYVKIDLKKEEE